MRRASLAAVSLLVFSACTSGTPFLAHVAGTPTTSQISSPTGSSSTTICDYAGGVVTFNGINYHRVGQFQGRDVGQSDLGRLYSVVKSHPVCLKRTNPEGESSPDIPVGSPFYVVRGHDPHLLLAGFSDQPRKLYSLYHGAPLNPPPPNLSGQMDIAVGVREVGFATDLRLGQVKVTSPQRVSRILDEMRRTAHSTKPDYGLGPMVTILLYLNDGFDETHVYDQSAGLIDSQYAPSSWLKALLDNIIATHRYPRSA